MRPFWGRLGILLPIYRLVGQGLTDREITSRLNLADDKVQDCISWNSAIGRNWCSMPVALHSKRRARITWR
jgi:hypothetical protein